MSGQGDIFRRPWKPLKLDEEEREVALGYARHVRGVMAPRVRLRPAHARKMRETQAVSRRARIYAALGASEVAVKLISHGRGLDSVKRQLRYIARDGDVPLERAFGEVVEDDRDAIDAIADEWSMAFHSHGDSARNSVHMMVSAPAGSDPDAVENAAREFAADLFGSNWDYVMARHDDTANPHVHIVAETRGLDGNLFSLDPQDFQPLREHFAELCREEGLDVTATSRAVRGVMDRGEPTGVVKMREGGRAPDRDDRTAAGGDAARERSAEERLIAQEAEANRALAAELRGSNRPEDQRAAAGLDRLATRAEGVLGRSVGRSDEPDADATASGTDITEKEAQRQPADQSAKPLETTAERMAAFLRLKALREREYADLRDRFDKLPPGERRDAFETLEKYERTLGAADKMLKDMRDAGRPPGEPSRDVEQRPASHERHDRPPDRPPPRGRDRDDDRDR